MQEDNLDKWLASSLRKSQEENPVPYQIGAWEAFEEKRKKAKTKTLLYWISGVAASLLLLGYTVISLDFSGSEISDKNGLAIKTEPIEATPSPLPQEEVAIQLVEPSTSENQASADLNFSERSNAVSSISSKPLSASEKVVASQLKPDLKPSELTQEAKKSNQTTTSTQLAFVEESKEKAFDQTKNTESVKSDSIQQAQVELLKKQIAELTGEGEEVVEKEKSSWAMALGLTPGFGSGQQDNQTVTGSSIGVGVQMNLALSEKLSIGSGMGVNYFSQSSEGLSVISFANAAYPANEKTEVQQIQLDIPLLVSYPLTRNKSIILQAGFSNLLAINQNGQQEQVYTRQIAVADAQTSGANSVAFRNESVSAVSDLNSPSQKFYPFATANLGVNIRVLETKKTSYLLMPFYNYPLQDVSGTGNSLGFFGAALKVNFGTWNKK